MELPKTILEAAVVSVKLPFTSIRDCGEGAPPDTEPTLGGARFCPGSLAEAATCDGRPAGPTGAAVCDESPTGLTDTAVRDGKVVCLVGCIEPGAAAGKAPQAVDVLNGANAALGVAGGVGEASAAGGIAATKVPTPAAGVKANGGSGSG